MCGPFFFVEVHQCQSMFPNTAVQARPPDRAANAPADDHLQRAAARKDT